MKGEEEGKVVGGDGSGDGGKGEEVEKPPVEKVVFPPPASWYKSSISASRDSMWGYCASGVIVLVYPKVVTPTPTTLVKEEEEGSWRRKGDNNKGRSRWPRFELIGAQLGRYLGISFCQSPWDLLPVKGAPLVSSCDKGIVRVWNLEEKATVIYHDNHAGNAVPGLDWSPADHSIIYSIDDKGNLSVWNVITNTLRSVNFGKVEPTCLNASPHEADVLCFGVKRGNVFVVSVAGNTGKILAKVRHEEEVISTLWMPRGEWDTLQYLRSDSKSKLPILVSNIHSMKIPSIRVWNKMGSDIGSLQSWERDNRARPFKMFGSTAWAKDPNSGKLMLISSGRHGELQAWTNGNVHDTIHRVHTHNAIFSIVQCGDILWSLSYEAMIVGWNLRTMELECVIPTMKGCCTIAPSPVDPSRLAIGGTDSVIRVLKCNSGYPTEEDTCTRSPVLIHKLKGKVTALAWHPKRDNFIGFGTDEGVLGVYELRENNSYAMMFDRRVSGKVYTVAFGPPVWYQDTAKANTPFPSGEEESGNSADVSGDSDANEETPERRKDPFVLYACGGNSVFQVNPSRQSNPLINVGRIIDSTNPISVDGETRRFTDKVSEIRWAPDYSLLAVGYGNGVIELFAPPHLKLRCWIKCHLLAIRYLLWRSSDFGVEETKDTRWLASTSKDKTTRLYNLATVFNQEQEQGPEMVISSQATFQGQGICVNSCAFSPHDKRLLCTVAYDSTAIIWNIEDGSQVARYMGHQQRLVVCSFHPSDPFRVISVSDEQSKDFAVHVWDYREHPFRRSVPKAPSGCKPAHPIKAANETLQIENPAIIQVMPMQDSNEKIHPIKGTQRQEVISKKPKLKSLLPITSNWLINAKLSLTKELKFLAGDLPEPIESGTENPAEQPSCYLGLLRGSDDTVKQIEIERKNHEEQKHVDQSAILATWLNDPRTIQESIRSRQVTETVLISAMHFSRKLYTEALSVFAEQLLDKEEYIRASHTYLILGKHQEAVKVLVDHSFYREAVAMINANMPNGSATNLAEVLDKWGAQAEKDGNFELATKIYFSMGKYPNALSCIEKRNCPYAYQTGCYISSKIGDEKKLEVLGSKFVLDGILRGEYGECYGLINEYPSSLKYLTILAKLHEAMTSFSKFVTGLNETQNGMWETELVRLINGIFDFLKRSESTDLNEDYRKIMSNILVSIAQNENDAQQIITRNLSLLLIEKKLQLDDKTPASTRMTEVAKLAHLWFEKNLPLYFAIVMTAVFIGNNFGWPSSTEICELGEIGEAYGMALIAFKELSKKTCTANGEKILSNGK